LNFKFELYNNNITQESFLVDIQTHFERNTKTIHKARNELKVIPLNNINTIVKSFKIPNVLNKLIYTFFRDSKAKRSYDYSLKISSFVPLPIGYIEFYKSGLLDQSYFVSEQFNYDYTIREVLTKQLNKTDEQYNDIYKAFARFTYELHTENIFHHDYSPGNILIKEDDSELIFKIVDINRMTFNKLDEIKRAQNFEKLWASDDSLKVMADEYTKFYNAVDREEFKKNVLYFSNKNKKIKNFKKRLKGKPVTD